MSLAKADTRALALAEKQLYKYGGLAVWTDIVAPAVTDSFGNVTTPAVTADYNISVLLVDIEDGWINAGIANANNKVFLVAEKQLSDYGVAFDGQETITYNGDKYAIELDKGYSAGQVIVLHRFICTITT